MTLEPRIAALLFALASLFLLAVGVRAARGRPVLAVSGGLLALALLSLSGLFAALAMSVHGYRALLIIFVVILFTYHSRSS